MLRLTMIGYWRSERQPELPDPADLIDPDWDRWERARVASYLETGVLAVQWRGYSQCRLCNLVPNGSADLTDGTYFWPSGLCHYVAEHSVRLPAAVVAHIIKQADALESAVRSAYDRGPGEWLAMLGLEQPSP